MRHSSASRQTALRSADFSAGAHLAGLLAATWHDADWFPAARICRRTDRMRRCCAIRWSRRERMHTAAALCVWQVKMLRNSGDFRWKRWFSARMPRTFLWHTLTDATVPVENTLLLEAALRRETSATSCTLFPHGVHGLALADLETADPMKAGACRPAYKPLAGALRGMAEGGITMQIRHTRPEDLPAMQEILRTRGHLCAKTAIPDQWGDRFPTQEMLDKDLALHRSYVCEDNGKIAATFCVYDRRRADLSRHSRRRLVGRCAVRRCPPYRGGKGHARRGFVLHELVHGAVRQHPHRDTHANNKPMQGLLNKLGYTLLRCH